MIGKPAIFAYALIVSSLSAKDYEFKLSIDPLIDIPDSFAMSQDQFEKTFAPPKDWEGDNPYFKWLTKDRDRAVFMKQPWTNISIKLSLFDGKTPCDEVTVDFVEGQINGINISIYNRADGGPITAEQFNDRYMLTGKKMSELTKARPSARKANIRQGLLTEGYLWRSKLGMAALEKNPEADQGDFQFLRLRLTPHSAVGPIANSMRAGNRTSIRKSDLPEHVAKDGSAVLIKGIPMVDQGPKGYCVVASAQRLFEHYGIPCDQHQLAQVVGSDVESGTNSGEVMRALSKLDFRFKTRFSILACAFSDGKLYSAKVRSDGDVDPGSEFDGRDFKKTVARHIDAGIPLLWALQLGRFPEEPPISKQASGGHMRMIIGYDLVSEKVIFTDSWGAGHERKMMTMEHAFAATTALYIITPTIN
jgi:hypothetical protein